jgi:hypothetical protein
MIIHIRNLKGRDHSADLYCVVRIILKWVLNRVLRVGGIASISAMKTQISTFMPSVVYH